MRDQSVVENSKGGVRKLAAEILAIPLDQLTKPEIGKLGFLDGTYLFESCKHFAKIANTASMEDVPFAQVSELQEKLRSLIAVINQIVSLQLIPENIGSRDSLMNTVEVRHRELYFSLAPIVAFESDSAKALEDAQREIMETRAKVTSEAQKFQDELKRSQTEAANLLTTLQSFGKNAGLTREAIHFSESSERHAKAATRWLVVSTIIGVAMVSYAICLIHPRETALVDSVQQAILHYVPRFIFFSIAITAWIFCLRNYNSSKHNQIVNEHRAVSLSTFEVFAGGTKNPAVTDAVLLEASRCAFSAQPTGFLRTEGDGPQFNQAIEVVKAAKGD